MGKRQHNHTIWSSRNPSTSTGFRFPQELITEILLRLPVKSLLNFKCVSKSWLSLISSPQFIKSHVSTSSMEGEHLNHQLLFTTGNPIPGIKQCSLYAAFHEPSTQVFDIDYPSQSRDHHPRIVGVIDGLLCLAINRNAYCRSAEHPYYEHFLDYNDLFLWNPVLRKSKHLPNSNVGVEPRFKYVNHGFGYDELNDDYKVVTLITVYGSSGVYETEVNVYSLRADSWRRIGDLKGFVPTYDWGMYANGKIYWCGIKLGDSYTIGNIVSLDMGSEKYGELQQPDYEPGDYTWNFKVVGGRPSVLCDYYYQTKADLWVMDKDGVEESWCKVVSIPYVDDVQSPTLYSPQKVLCILSNGEIVLINEFGLFVYHSKHKEFRNIELGLCDSPYYEVVEYVESLVSPNGSFV